MRMLQWMYEERKAKIAFEILFLFLTGLLLAGCGVQKAESDRNPLRKETAGADYAEEKETVQAEESAENPPLSGGGETDIIEIPAYSGHAYAEVNGNIPYFEDNELSEESFGNYSELDRLGRCGVCTASIGRDIMPEEERGEIGSIRPSGWHTVKYTGIIDGNYLYNRCHLIGYQLAGENANIKNLITGTRYMNTEGMLPFENMVADYVEETGNHVMYRVTPVFEGENLLADGVLMEAKSVEDKGAGISFNIFCYNVQPGIIIDYATGDSMADSAAGIMDGGQTAPEEMRPKAEATPDTIQSDSESEPEAEASVYAVNSKNGKIHKTGECPATGNGDSAMKSPVYFGTYEEAEAYSFSVAPKQDKRRCGNCWQ